MILDDRVRDPIEEKKAAVVARAARTRANLDEYNERSDRLRQDWATSQNEVLRMAGNALREVVVCAEEDLLMLEDELGRLEGILAPADRDGPAGRVTSGQYGSEVGGAARAAGARGRGRHTLLAGQRVPSLPRSPTMPVEPQSASKLGVQGEDSSGRGGSSSDGPSPAVAAYLTGDRVKSFLMGPMDSVRAQSVDPTGKKNLTTTAALGSRPRAGVELRSGRQTFSSLHEAPPTPAYARPVKQGDDKHNESPSPSTAIDVPLPPAAGSGMGLVEWQTKYGNQALTAADDSPEFWDRLNVKPLQVNPSPDSTTSVGMNPHDTNASISLFHPVPYVTGPVEPVFRRPNRQLAARLANPLTTGVAQQDSEETLPSSTLLPESHNYGFHVAQPLGRHPSGDLNTTVTPLNPFVTEVGRPISAHQSVAVKDFQARVWKSATATATMKGPPAAEKANGAKGKEKGEARTRISVADAYKDMERIREDFRRQIAERAAAKQAAEDNGGQSREGSGAKREDEASEKVDR